MRDICHAAKHGDLKWDSAEAATFGPETAKLEYQAGKGRDLAAASLWVITTDGVRHNVLDVLHRAISDWTNHLDQSGI